MSARDGRAAGGVPTAAPRGSAALRTPLRDAPAGPAPEGSPRGAAPRGRAGQRTGPRTHRPVGGPRTHTPAGGLRPPPCGDHRARPTTGDRRADRSRTHTQSEEDPR
ncbi:hypothetical protein GCM10009602_65980 [Nocardiopsis tropica]